MLRPHNSTIHILTSNAEHLALGGGAQVQRNIRVGLAVPGLASTGRDTVTPADVGTGSVGGKDVQSVAGEGITEDIGHVVPDGVAVQGVGEVGLGTAVIQTVLAGGNLQRDATGGGIVVQQLRIHALGLDGDLRANRAANGPQVDGEVAVIHHAGLADSANQRSQGGNRGDNGSGEMHCGRVQCRLEI